MVFELFEINVAISIVVNLIEEFAYIIPCLLLYFIWKSSLQLSKWKFSIFITIKNLESLL